MKKTEWRCQQCGKLLGKVEGTRLHLKFGRGYDYLVSLPATSVCRKCHSLNELTTHKDVQKEAILTSR